MEGTFTARNLAPNDIKKVVDAVNKISHKAFGKEKDLIGRVYERAIGNVKSTKTILKHPEKYHVESAIKLGDYNVGRMGQILTLPLYMAFLLRAL